MDHSSEEGTLEAVAHRSADAKAHREDGREPGGDYELPSSRRVTVAEVIGDGKAEGKVLEAECDGQRDSDLGMGRAHPQQEAVEEHVDPGGHEQSQVERPRRTTFLRLAALPRAMETAAPKAMPTATATSECPCGNGIRSTAMAAMTEPTAKCCVPARSHGGIR